MKSKPLDRFMDLLYVQLYYQLREELNHEEV